MSYWRTDRDRRVGARDAFSSKNEIHLWKAKMETDCMYIQPKNARIFLRKSLYAARITYLHIHMIDIYARISPG